jgi:hypothetical protein
MLKLEEIYLRLQSKSIERSHFFGRALCVVTFEDFIEYKQYFKESTNILNLKENFRTDNYFKHIHAVKTNDYIEFHYDYGNPDKHFLLVLVHGVIDVIPYFLHSFYSGRKPYAIKEDI